MLINRVVPIYTNDMQILFKVKIGKNHIINTAIHKIAKMYNLEKKGYADIKKIIEDIADEVNSLLNETLKDLNKIKSRLAKISVTESNTFFKCINKYNFKFGNELVLNFLRLLETCDLYFAYMMVSKSTPLFKYKGEVHSLIKQKRKKFFSLVSKISSTSLKDVELNKEKKLEKI